MPIVSMALYDYFVEGKSVPETIHNHRDVYDFMKVQRVNTQTFDIQLLTVPTKITSDTGEGDSDVIDSDEQQKTTRYIVSTHGGSLVKIRKGNGQVYNLCSGENVMITNDVESKDARDYPINYDYYIKETYKIIDKIQPPIPFIF